MNDASVLLIGDRGMLGQAIARELTHRGIPFDAASRPELDITDEQAVERHVQPRHRTVINCAAWTDVDAAEDNFEAAESVNAAGPALLAERCRHTGAKLVHYSTDYVFNGHADTPWSTAAPIDPVNAYGRTKAEGERAIVAAGCDSLILRTSWLYAPWGKNFVLTMVKLMGERDELTVVDDQRGRPTSVLHLARMTLDLLDQEAAGILHATDGGECTWFGFADCIRECVGSACDVKPCTSDAFPRSAKRPAYSVLDLTPTEAYIGPRPHWHECLDEVLEMVATGR